MAELKCVADDKSAQIAWFKGNPGTQITEDFVHLTFLVGSMRIFRIRKDDAGSYYCKASTSLETVTSRTATLTVQCKSFLILPHRPTFIHKLYT